LGLSRAVRDGLIIDKAFTIAPRDREAVWRAGLMLIEPGLFLPMCRSVR